MKKALSHVKNTTKKYSKWITPVALFLGFVADLFTLNRIDEVFDNAILITHIVLVGIAITILYRDKSLLKRTNFWTKLTKISRFIIPFSLGGLFSGFVIFYGRSASFSASLFFVLVLVVIMLSLEFSKAVYRKLVIQLATYYMAVFLYLTFLIPVLLKKISPEVFIFSSLLSLVYIVLFIHILKRIERMQIRFVWKKLKLALLGVLAVFNVLYFTNIIPPIPLSLTFKSVYHSIVRTPKGNYIATYEKTPWYIFWDKRSSTVHRESTDDIYVFSAIFAPKGLETTIVHQWQYKHGDVWTTTDEIAITITGGRDGGYRGFSRKTNLSEDKWRVRIMTERGQILGIERFQTTTTSSALEFAEELL